MKKFLSFQNIFVALVIIIFGWLKFSHLFLRFSDGNIYMYMAKSLGLGLWPYRDFFLADPPVSVLCLALVRSIFRNNWVLYQTLPVVWEVGSAILIFLILRRRRVRLAFLAPLFYLFSFTVLATSDYMTGVQLAVFFTVLAFYLFEKDQIVLSGISLSLACLVKLYVVPAFAGFLLFLIIQRNYKVLWKIVLTSVATVAVVLGPFLILNWRGVYQDLILMHLHRPMGINKLTVFQFFINHEWFLLLSGIMGLALAKKFKDDVLFWPLVLNTLFFVLYKDVYYLYLDSLIFYLSIFSITWVSGLWAETKKVKLIGFVFLILCSASLVGNIFTYWQELRNADRFLNVGEIADYVKTLPSELYGAQETASLVALVSGKKLFNNYIDTNAQVFAAGTLDLQKVSQEVADHNVYLIARIVDLPQYGIQDVGYEGYFSKEIFAKYCSRVKEFTSTSGEIDNKIAVYQCKDH